ncbi:hypothetical protein KAT36_02710 [Candidatus Pacearchaeota archaeon]|nr:hypothetical protein [Candidatus Pacearchaeota archaeon]
MFERKCKACAEKINRKFNYCPWCGAGVRGSKIGSQGDLGMLGSDDAGKVQESLKLPFGVNKIVNSLVKQLERQMGNMDFEGKQGIPKGFKIQIGQLPTGQVMKKESPKKLEVMKISHEERERRAKLKKVKAESKVRRLGDVIIYEIEAPGVQREEDIVMTELETGIEIRAYSKDRCYVKVIPLKVEILGWRVEGERVMVEMKG